MKIRETKIKKETIEVPIYWCETDKGKILIDEDCMREEFDDKMADILHNPTKYVKK